MTDYTNLIERLRKIAKLEAANAGLDPSDAAEWEAADAIKALQSECAEHKENAIRNARQALAFRAERDALQSEINKLRKDTDRLNANASTLQQIHEDDVLERNALKAKLDALEEENAIVVSRTGYLSVEVLVQNYLTMRSELDALQSQELVGYVKQKQGYPQGSFFVLWNKLVKPGDLLYAAPQALAPTQSATEKYCGKCPLKPLVDAAHGIGGTP